MVPDLTLGSDGSVSALRFHGTMDQYPGYALSGSASFGKAELEIEYERGEGDEGWVWTTRTTVTEAPGRSGTFSGGTTIVADSYQGANVPVFGIVSVRFQEQGFPWGGAGVGLVREIMRNVRQIVLSDPGIREPPPPPVPAPPRPS